MKYEATTTSNYNVQNNLESVSTKFANRQDQLDPSTTHNRQNTGMLLIYIKVNT